MAPTCASVKANISTRRTPDGAREPKTTIADSAGNAAPGQAVLADDPAGTAYLAWIEHRDGQSGCALR